MKKSSGSSSSPSLEVRGRISATLKGHAVSEETRQKIGESGKGRIPWNKGRTGVYNKETLERMREGARKSSVGRVYSDETKERIRAVVKTAWETGSRKLMAHGADNGNWLGGKDVLPSWALGEWRKLVMERDDYTCQLCGTRGGKLQADHIISKWVAPHLIYFTGNGRTLCRPCHRQTGTYGDRGWNRRKREYQIPLPLVVKEALW